MDPPGSYMTLCPFIKLRDRNDIDPHPYTNCLKGKTQKLTLQIYDFTKSQLFNIVKSYHILVNFYK